MMLQIGILAVYVVVVPLLLWWFVRNQRVLTYRTRLNREVSEACSVDIKKRREWRWRYQEYDKVKYEDMIFPLWSSLDNYYPHRDKLVDPKVTKDDYYKIIKDS